MPYLARKVTRAKWDGEDDFAEDEIPADAVTADLRTTNNTLSFWRVELASNDEIRRTALALATAAERIDRMDIAWVEENSFGAHYISMNPSDGRTPVASLRSNHVDVTKLDLGRLGKVATFIAEALSQGQHCRFTKKEVVQIIVKAVREDLVSINDLEPKVKEEIGNAIDN
ncbi:MAG: hypothetical protein L0312_02225 [Acidobacteria bacterium]|nr:hypothetical protein [Acidobacteriota bacterium]